MSEPDPQPEFSVILACYNQELSIREFHRRLCEVMQSLARPYEIVLTNDGSPDGTLAVLEDLFREDPCIRAVVDFQANSGQAAALTAGILESRGRAFIFVDSDLQLDPEDIPKLVACFDTGVDLVGGRRRTRQDPLFRRLASRAANALVAGILQTEMRDIFCCFKIMRADIVKSIGYGPGKLFHIVEVMRRCATCREVEVSHHPRPHGRSGYSLARLIALLIGASMHAIGAPWTMAARQGTEPKYTVRQVSRREPRTE